MHKSCGHHGGGGGRTLPCSTATHAPRAKLAQPTAHPDEACQQLPPCCLRVRLGVGVPCAVWAVARQLTRVLNCLPACATPHTHRAHAAAEAWQGQYGQAAAHHDKGVPLQMALRVVVRQAGARGNATVFVPLAGVACGTLSGAHASVPQAGGTIGVRNGRDTPHQLTPSSAGT